jgi:meso-butanediol dehydrogenase/(S,S)-butanediol dehydrogenase/diacetyl reductase
MGAANAEAFAEQGANVCLGDVNEDGRRAGGRRRINAQGNGKAVASAWTSQSREDNAAAVAATVEAFGSINVGGLQRRPEQAPVLHGYR